MEHLTQKQIEDYSHNNLRPAELLAVSDHLGECERCRQQIETSGNVDAAFFALHAETVAGNGQTAHLTSAQTADYVDKNLAGEQLLVASDHLRGCAHCQLAVEDLLAFRNEIAPSLDREFGPATAPATATETNWRQRFVSFFRISPIPAFSGAALAILVLMFVAWIVWRSPRENRPELVAVPSPSLQPSPVATPSFEPAPPPIVAQLQDGAGVVSLDQEGTLAGADDLPANYQSLVKNALSGQRIEKPRELQGLTRPPGTLMGPNDKPSEFSVLEPAGTVLLTDRPRFRWSSMAGASSYVVEIYDNQFKLIATSGPLTATSWTTPRSLPRGQIYSWQVKATKEGQETTVPRPPAPQAKFRVLDQAKTNELVKAKRLYGSSHLTLALLYADAGLLKEAEAELSLLRKANPDSEIVRRLQRQVRTLQR